MKYRILTLLISLFSLLNLFSQGFLAGDNPSENVAVDWKISIKRLSDKMCEVKFNANINKNRHIYDIVKQKGVKQTSFVFNKLKNVTLHGKIVPSAKPETINDNALNKKVKVYTGNVTFTQKLKIIDPDEDININGYVNYISCGDNTCTPPKKINFSLKL